MIFIGDGSRLQQACLNYEPPLRLSHSGSFAKVLGDSEGASEHRESDSMMAT